jgi:hypothetical protein
MNPSRATNCPRCLVAHDEEIHGATVRIHAWLRREILRQIVPWQPAERPPKPSPDAAQ